MPCSTRGSDMAEVETLFASVGVAGEDCDTLRAPKVLRGRARRQSFAAAFVENRMGVAGLGIVVTIAGFCFLGPLVYHSDQIHASIALTNLAPGAGHPLGTDANGFDIRRRLMVEGRSAREDSLS